MMDLLKTLVLVHCFCLCLVDCSDLCGQSFCKCPNAGKEVVCDCNNENMEVLITPKSLPLQAKTFHLSNCGQVSVSTNSFAQCLELKTIHFDVLKHLTLHQKFYSKELLDYREITNWTLSKVGRLELKPDAFVNFPKSVRCEFKEVGLGTVEPRGLEMFTDTFIIRESTITKLKKASIYSDAMYLNFQNNRIEHIDRGAFDASVRTFDFVGNTVDHIDNMGLSVAALIARINANTFHNQDGSPFLDFGPDPVCMQDPDVAPEEDEYIPYNIVANPTLEFMDNYFHAYTDELLRFPGANNVPLGSLKLDGNKLKCDCETLKNFTARVDFEHIFKDDAIHGSLDLGARIFQKEFYDSGLCVDSEGATHSLKGYLRGWSQVVRKPEQETFFLVCINPSTKTKPSLPSVPSPFPTSPTIKEAETDFAAKKDSMKNDAYSSSTKKRCSFSVFTIVASIFLCTLYEGSIV